MALTEAQNRANKKWDKNNLDRIQLVVRKGEREQIRAAAAAAGESLNHYIVTATRYRMEQGILFPSGSTGEERTGPEK